MNYCVVYVSTSIELLREIELATLLLQSRRANARTGITGVLLCLSGRIIQVLEGEKEAINTLFNRIKQDSRHTNINTIFHGPIDQRLFAAWWMGYETLTVSQLEEVTIIANLNQQIGPLSRTESATILKRVKVFFDTNRIH